MIPEGTAFWGVVLKQMILGASAFSAGVLMYRALFVERRRRRPFLICGLVGVVIEILLISELVVRAPLVNPDFRAILYVLGLILIGAGFLGDAFRSRKRYELEQELLKRVEAYEKSQEKRDADRES